MEKSKYLGFLREVYELIKSDYPELLKITDESTNNVESPSFDDITRINIDSNPRENWGEITVAYNYKNQHFCNGTTISKIN